MKKLIMLCAFVAASFLSQSASAQGMGMDPKMMVQRQIDRMTTEVGLSTEQVAKIEPLLTVRIEKMMQLREAGMDREEMMAEMKKVNDSQLDLIKAILSPEQFEKYKTMQNQTRQGGPPRN